MTSSLKSGWDLQFFRSFCMGLWSGLVQLATGLASLKEPNIDETKALLPSGFGEMTALMYRVLTLDTRIPSSSLVSPQKIVQKYVDVHHQTIFHQAKKKESFFITKEKLLECSMQKCLLTFLQDERRTHALIWFLKFSQW